MLDFRHVRREPEPLHFAEYFTAESFQGHGPVIPVELKQFEREEKTSLFRKLLDCGVIIEGLEISVSMPEAFYLVGFENKRWQWDQ